MGALDRDERNLMLRAQASELRQALLGVLDLFVGEEFPGVVDDADAGVYGCSTLSPIMTSRLSWAGGPHSGPQQASEVGVPTNAPGTLEPKPTIFGHEHGYRGTPVSGVA